MRAEIEAEGGRSRSSSATRSWRSSASRSCTRTTPSARSGPRSPCSAPLDEVNPGCSRDDDDVTWRMRIGVNTGEVLADAGRRARRGDGDRRRRQRRRATAGGGRARRVAGLRADARAAAAFAFADRGGLELQGQARAGTRVPPRGCPSTARPAASPTSRADGRAATPSWRSCSACRPQRRREGRPHLVTVFGEPGVGKSRLVREFLDAAADRTSRRRWSCAVGACRMATA